MKRSGRPKWATRFYDRFGQERWRFRRKGYAQYLFKHKLGEPGFWQEYEACVAGLAAEPIAPGAEKAKAGSFDDLISRYYRSPDFLDPGERTQVVYRGVLERWRATVGGNGRRYGEGMVRDLAAHHVEAMMAKMLPHRTAANMLRKRLGALLKFAIRQGLVRDNPVTPTRPFKVEGGGFHTWTEAEIAAYEARHPVGSKARLALDLMLWTGQRGGDARLMGPQHVRGKRLVVTQEKTGATVSLPVLAPLAASILAAPSGSLVFLVSEHGKPFSRKGFGNIVRQWCDEAGLPNCSAHGLRKAAARRFAEAGCSNQEIKAWTGHVTDSEVARYTAAADQTLLSDAAAERLIANLRNRLANGEAKPLQGKN
ncbi:tyrosine-type recombinase/integrase [Sphingomonas sp. BN140010]|uniref:Tyrosine-type recombinase/integrase n=1 Tax=Sphingomonas arvum TaxID=2992113 RepID=A0ABT3JCV6_9SPHN|nr:tyrosine-type recombinase/integrase [Sphingomonas sp. BN140010]MCW3796914.1 tyrosine-type recombinase/integrase [Sphingomonas sp. BN140010]